MGWDRADGMASADLFRIVPAGVPHRDGGEAHGAALETAAKKTTRNVSRVVFSCDVITEWSAKMGYTLTI